MCYYINNAFTSAEYFWINQNRANLLLLMMSMTMTMLLLRSVRRADVAAHNLHETLPRDELRTEYELLVRSFGGGKRHVDFESAATIKTSNMRHNTNCRRTNCE